MSHTNQQEATGSAPKVIYILGSAYCGSTILGFLLGASKDVFNAGEIAYYQQLQEQDEMCSCGVPSTNCEFWKPLYERHYRVFRTIGARQKITIFMSLLLGRRPTLRPEKTDDTSLLKGIAQRSLQMGKPVTCVLDNSKRLERLIHLQRTTGLTVKVLYLKRDIRGNMASFLKHGQRFVPALLKYIIYNRAMWRYIRFPEVDALSVDYSQLCRSPQSELERMARFLGIAPINYPQAVRTEQFHVPSGNMGTRNQNLAAFEGLRFDASWKKRLNQLQIFLLSLFQKFNRFEPGYEKPKTH